MGRYIAWSLSCSNFTHIFKNTFIWHIFSGYDYGSYEPVALQRDPATPDTGNLSEASQNGRALNPTAKMGDAYAF